MSRPSDLHLQPSAVVERDVILMGLPGSGKSAFYHCAVTGKNESEDYTASMMIEYEAVELDPHRAIRIWDPSSSHPSVVKDGKTPLEFLSLLGKIPYYSDIHTPEKPTIFLWFVDATNIDESVNYINRNAKHVNATICHAEHYLVVSKTDLVQENQRKSIDVQIPIKDVFYSSIGDTQNIKAICSAFLPTEEDVSEQRPDLFQEIGKIFSPKKNASSSEQKSELSLQSSRGELKKIVVVGANGSGKSALLERFVWDRFSEKHELGERPYSISLGDSPAPNAFYCWDFPSDCINGHMFNVYFSSVSAVLYCVSLDSEKSMEAAIDYLIRLRFHPQSLRFDAFGPVYVTLTQSDRSVYTTFQEVKDYVVDQVMNLDRICKVMGYQKDQDIQGAKLRLVVKRDISFKPVPPIHFSEHFFVTSSKTGAGLEDMFRELGQQCFDTVPDSQKISVSLNLKKAQQPLTSPFRLNTSSAPSSASSTPSKPAFSLKSSSASKESSPYRASVNGPINGGYTPESSRGNRASLLGATKPTGTATAESRFTLSPKSSSNNPKNQ